MTTAKPIDIAKVVQNAVVFNFKNWISGSMNSDTLPESVTRLFTLLDERHINYVLVGGIALLHYVEGRNTEDIDLIMALSSLQKLPEIELSSQDINFAQGQLDELKIDILLTRNPLFKKVHQNYVAKQSFIKREIPCATVEGLLLLKLYALPSLYRQGNFARVGLYENDIASLIYAYQPDLEMIFAELAPHLSDSDIASVREIVAEIEQRINRFGKGFAK